MDSEKEWHQNQVEMFLAIEEEKAESACQHKVA